MVAKLASNFRRFSPSDRTGDGFSKLNLINSEKQALAWHDQLKYESQRKPYGTGCFFRFFQAVGEKCNMKRTLLRPA